MIEWIVPSIASTAACLAFIWQDIRRLERRYVEKDRLLDEQLTTAKTLVTALSKEQQEIDRKGLMLAELITKAKPLVEYLDKSY